MNKRRRLLLKTLASGIVVFPVTSLFAGEGTRLDPEDPAAKNLNYMAESVDANRRCRGCQFFTASEDAEWGQCVIFPGKLVNARGLCNSWYARAG